MFTLETTSTTAIGKNSTGNSSQSNTAEENSTDSQIGQTVEQRTTPSYRIERKHRKKEYLPTPFLSWVQFQAMGFLHEFVRFIHLYCYYSFYMCTFSDPIHIYYKNYCTVLHFARSLLPIYIKKATHIIFTHTNTSTEKKNCYYEYHTIWFYPSRKLALLYTFNIRTHTIHLYSLHISPVHMYTHMP